MEWQKVNQYNWELRDKISTFRVFYEMGLWYVSDNGYLWPYSYQTASQAKETVNGFID